MPQWYPATGDWFASQKVQRLLGPALTERKLLHKTQIKPGVLSHAGNSNIWNAEAGKSSQGQFGMHNKPCQKTNKKLNLHKTCALTVVLSTEAME